MKRLLKIIGVTATIILIAVIAIYARVPAKKTNASGVPTASITWDGNAGWHISLSSDGPFTQDIQVKICVTSNNSTNGGYGTLSSGSSYPYVYCATTPWASQTTAYTPGWSPWIWPGYDNGLYVGLSTTPEHVDLAAGTGVTTVSINTQPLPIAGETLTNVSLGLDVAETNGGPGNYDTPYVPCEQGFTPAGGGTSVAIFAYTYQNCPSTWQTNPASGASTWPDSVQAGISATLNTPPNAQHYSDNIPTSFNVSEAKTTGTDGNPLNIVMQNTGAAAWTSDLHTAVGTPTGICTYDSNKDGVNDAPTPNAANNGASCVTTYNYYSSQIKLQHTASSFSLTPETVSYSNIVKVTNTVVYVPSTKYCAEYSSSGGLQNALNIIPEWLMKTAHAASIGGPSICRLWDWTDPYYYISSSNSGSLNVLPNATTTFTISSMKAPSTPNTYTEAWQMQNNGTPFGTSFAPSITVSGNSAPSGGTITVTSQNAVNTSTLVNAAWDLTGQASAGSAFVCEAALGNILWNSATPCSGTNETYSGVSTNYVPYTLPDATTKVASYSLRSIKQIPIAEKKNNSVLDPLRLSIRNIFSTPAFAQIFGITGPTSTIIGVNSATLTPTNPSVGFVILWNPNADMQVSPSSVSLTSAAPSQAVTVQNTGAPYSTLTWTATASTASGGNWLSVTPGGTIQNGGSGGTSGTTNAATVSYAGGLAAGTYNGTVTFTGWNGTSTLGIVPPFVTTIPITLTVGTPPTGGTTYFTCFSSSCAATSVSGATSCAAACGVPASTLTATCSPASIALGQTSQCVLKLNGTPQTATWSVGSGSTGSIGASSGVYTPSVAGTESISGTLPDGSSAQATVTVTGSSGPSACSGANCPVCSPTLTASPTSIVVPESSKLSYSCSNVTECQLTQGTTLLQDIGAGTSEQVSSTYSVQPTSTTIYTLTCVNSNYGSNGNNPITVTAPVTVSGSSFCEQNPNGVGCPGQ